MYGTELIQHLDAPRGDIAGDPIDKLVNHLDQLEDFSKKLGAQSGLYLSDKDGRLYGLLTRAELEPICKRIQEKIDKKIEQCKAEIRKKID